jgi:hypothetical protein
METPGAFSLPSDATSKAPSDVKITATESPTTATPLVHTKPRPFRFVATWHFWGILVLGQILSWCIVSTNTLTEYLSLAGANIPAFQTVFNYALLNLVYTSYTIYRYGFKKWGRLLWKDGWKYFILGFADVQGVSRFCPLRHVYVLVDWLTRRRTTLWSRDLGTRTFCRLSCWMHVQSSPLLSFRFCL